MRLSDSVRLVKWRKTTRLCRDRADAGQIAQGRWKKIVSIIKAQLNRYVGSTQINLVGKDKWDGYPLWRAKDGKSVNGRVSDATIQTEMKIFRAIMAYAAGKRLITESQVFKGKIAPPKVNREEFTPEEYRKLHTFAPSWTAKAPSDHIGWYRTVAYNFILIMCNTGMRPSEAKNLRWRDVAIRIDAHERKFVVLSVRGKDKFRNLVATGNVADYLERIRAISKATEPNDFVFTTIKGEPPAPSTLQ